MSFDPSTAVLIEDEPAVFDPTSAVPVEETPVDFDPSTAVLVQEDPALPAAQPSPLPEPPADSRSFADLQKLIDDDIREGIFQKGSTPWKALDGRLYIDPARYNMAVEQMWNLGVIDSTSYTQLLKGTVDQWDEASQSYIPSVEKATAARRDLERRAGAFPEAKAAASGLLKGAMQTGAAIVAGPATAAATIPTGPGAVVAGIAGGTAAALGTGYAYDKALEASAKESELLDSFYAANQLAPGYNSGGQLVSILAPTPLSISRLANAANLIRVEKGGAEAAKFIAGALGVGAGIGVGTDVAIQAANIGLDKILHPEITPLIAAEQSRQSGEPLPQRPEFDVASTAIAGTLGALTAGIGVKARNKTYAPNELVTLESQVRTGRASRQESEDYNVMRQAVETLRADERLINAQAIRRATVDAAGFRFLDTTEIINPRFQRDILTQAGFEPSALTSSGSRAALPYAAENPQAFIPLAGPPAAYTGQTFLNRGGAAPAFQGGSNALPGPEGIQALPGPAPEPSNIIPFDPSTATPVADIPPTASAPQASTLRAPESTGSPELITGEGASVSDIVGMPAVEFPVDQIKLSKDVPNFKENADPETGVVQGERLEGKVDRRGLAPIIAWRRLNGDVEVISGRHRLDLFRRNQEKTIPAQIFNEADGFNQQDALTLDAELNIRDGQGTTKDYASYFRNAGLSYDQATERSLLSRSKGRAGFTIGAMGSDDLYALHQAGRIPDAKAESIAVTAPRDTDLQAVGIRFAKDLSAPELVNLIKVTQLSRDPTAKQGDLFGNSDSNLNNAVALVKASRLRIKELEDQILSVKGAVKRPEAARKMGVDVKDPESIRRKIDQLTALRDKYDRFLEHPEILAEVRNLAFGEAAPLKPLATIDTNGEGILISEAEMPFNLVSESIGSTPPAEPVDEAALAEAARRKAGYDNTPSMFDAGPPAKSSRGGKTMADAGPPAPSASAFVPKSTPENAMMPLQITSLPLALEHAKQLVNRPLNNIETNMTANISLNSLSKIGNGKAFAKSVSEQAHALATANLDYLFKYSQLIDSHPDKKQNMNMEMVHRFGTAMVFGDKVYGVKITVHEYKRLREGNRIYTVEAVDVEKVEPAGQLVSDTKEAVPNTPLTGSAKKLLQIVQKVKSEMRPPLETYNDAQVFADFPDAVGVVRSSKGSGWTMPLILGGTDKVPAIEMPELVEMVRSLTGNNPVLKRTPTALGTFNPGSGIITLRPDLFQNEASAMLTFAHEIGHLVSWMDERNIKLGNLGGHIMNVSNFLKHAFPIDKGGQLITPKERRQLQAQARNSMPAGSMPEKDDPGRGDWEAEVATRYRELIQETMAERNLGYVGNRRGTFEDGAYDPNVREELIQLSEWWKPFNYDDANDSYVAYRHSAAELYADAISVLFNSPADLQQRAPTFWKAFWNYADARPQVKASIFEIQNRILNGRDAVLDKRLARDLASFKAGADVFIGKQTAAAERRASLTGWWDNLKDQYWNRYQPLIEVAAKARTAGKITQAEEDAYRWLTEEHPLADSKLQLKLADIGRLYQSLDAASVPRDYFGLWLKYHRIANERYDLIQKIDGQMQIVGETGRAVMANPGGETARTATEMLASIRQRLGTDKTAALESAVSGFRDVVFSIMADANEAGLFSPELWETISNNRDNYAAFTPLEYVQEYLPSAIRKQVGTFKEIADPLQQTVLKSISIHRAAQNNRFKRAAVEAIRQTAPEIVKAAPMKYNGKAMVPQEPQETGFSLVQWKEGGQLTGVHLPDRYARMWEDKSPAERDAILKLLSTGFQRLVYGAIIRYNPAFQLFMSPARDLQRSLTNMPGGIEGRARFLQRLLDPESWGAAVDWARGDIGKTTLLREMIETAATGGPHSAFGGRMGSDDDSIDAILRRYHLQDQQSRNAFVRAIMAPLKGIEFAGQVLQLLPKASAYKVLVKDMGMPAPQAANTVRNHIGIPNYYKKGRHAQAAGSLVPFLNIFLRSYDSLQRNFRGAERNMGGKEWWLAWAIGGGGLIAILQTLAREGVFGEDLQRLYSRVPEWDMTNFAVLPLGEVSTGETGGKTVYARLPQDEGLRVINGVVSKLLSSAIRSAKGDPAAPQLGEVFAGISSQVPGTNTLVELGQNWTTFLAGRNPRDDFRNRYILSDDQWLAGGWDAAKPMFGWTLEQTGITNFFTYDSKADTLTEMSISATPILNRFIKISDRGVYQSQGKTEEADKRDMAKLRLSFPDQVNGLRTEYNYLKTRGENRSDRETMRYHELGQWYRSYRQTMDEVETNMEFGNRAGAQSAIRALIEDSKLYRAR